MDRTDHVSVIAQLRQVQRLLRRGGLTLQETLEMVKLYEQGVCALLTSEQIVKYAEARMVLANDFLG